ncbi:hypothetical protein [Brevibacterium paucivorans]|uniref:hypothetical protein n=1 Tax=Brevibacterium paucivorans TaxID=170994 RepID=UPI0025E682F7|nr:hypothetical protein [uncultured Brevibacterium sp.]
MKNYSPQLGLFDVVVPTMLREVMERLFDPWRCDAPSTLEHLLSKFFLADCTDCASGSSKSCEGNYDN